MLSYWPFSSVSLASTAPAIFSRRRVELGRQAAHVDVRPPVELDHREHLAGDRAAREDEHVGTLGRVERDLRLEQLRRVSVHRPSSV